VRGRPRERSRWSGPRNPAAELAPGQGRRRFPHLLSTGATHRGLEIGLHLRPGLPDENFIAEAIGNLAAFRLQEGRGERLEWQVLRVEGSGEHHFRLVIRHPDRALDLGLTPDLKRRLDSLSNESVEELRQRFEEAQKEGLKLAPLRHVRDSVDFWQDDFWNWFG
jgi:hypothetical protein